MAAAEVVRAFLLIAQAWVVTGLVLAALDDGAVVAWAVAVVGVFLVRGLASWASDLSAARAAARVSASVRRGVLAAVLSGAAGRRPSGEVAALATRGATATEPYLTRYVPTLVLAGVLPVLTLVAIALVDVLSAVIILLTLPLIPVFGILVGLATRDKAESQWRALASLSGHFVDVMRGLPTLVAFRRARAQSQVIRDVTDRYRRRTLETLKVAFASSAILELVATISVALVAVTVGLRLAHGSMPLQSALVVLLLAPEAYWPLRRVGAEFHAAAEGTATFDAASELTVAAESPQMHARVASNERSRYALLTDVEVLYPDRTSPALRSVSLEVSGPGTTAITGPSGSGKSTLLAVLAGELQPTRGEVELPPPEQAAFLPQRPVFVAGSIADNLRLAAPDASDAQLTDVLARVGLDDRIDSLDDSLDEDGLSLSGGERARLALARVMLSGRPMVLLDEPTAHLDEATEQIIADVIAELGRTRAVVLVAHRPALVELADRVVTLAGHGVGLDTLGPSGPPGSTSEARPPLVERSFGETRRGIWGNSATTWVPTVLGGLASFSGVALTATAGWLIVQSSTMPPVLTLLVAIVGVRAFGLARPVLRYAERLTSHDTALRLLARERVAIYDAIVPLTPGGLRRDGRCRGDLLAAVVDDVDSVLDRELRVRLPVRAYVVLTILVTIVAVVIEPLAGLVLGLTCVVAGALGFGLARIGVARAERDAVGARAELSDHVLEVTQTAQELARWQAVEGALDRVDAAGRGLARATVRSAAWQGAARAVVLLVAGLGVAAMALTVSPLVGGPMLALLVLAPMALAEPATEVADAGALSVRTSAALARLDDLAHRPPVVTDAIDPLPAPDAADIAATNVSAGWGATPAFEGLDLSIRPGERVGVVGPSGSGKSTLASVLLRFVDPVAGQVRLGDRPMRDLALDDVRERVGIVDDDPHVFASTLAENVRFAKPGADDAEVADALRRAHLGSWLDDLPDGLATRLGDGGADVAGGERARIGVARSLLAEQPVLVLDEPTAHLDAQTATELATEVLGPSSQAVVWITHDPVGLEHVDRVLDLAGAQVTRSGPSE